MLNPHIDRWGRNGREFLLLLCTFLLPSIAGAQNVLIFLMDDVGKADVDALIADGRAPNLARISQRGFCFTSAMANPLCQPTRRTLDFGDFCVRSSGRVCKPSEGKEPPLSLVSLPELVGSTSMFFGKWHEGTNPDGPWTLTPQAHGWGGWRAGVPGGITACGGVDYSNWIRVEDGLARQAVTYQPEKQFDRLREWWSATNGPRLVMYSSALAHEPLHRPPDSWLPANYPPTPGNREKFEAMIAALDVQIGRILLLLSPDDFLIVTSDNGTPGLVSETPRAKGTTFERGIRVPLIVYGGWIDPGKSDALVHVADVYATVAELTGKKADPALDSRSLVPLILGATEPIHDYLLCGSLDHPPRVDDVCVRSLRYKLRRVGQPPREEFYDLGLDPSESTDRIDDPAYQVVIAQHRGWLVSALE